MRISHSAIIRQPVMVVFSCVTDFRLSSYWAGSVKEIEVLGAGPVRVGFSFRQVSEWQGRVLSHTYQVIEYLPPQRCLLKSIAGLFSTVVQYSFEPHPLGTCFTQEVSTDVADYFESGEQGLKQLQTDLATLKALVENTPLIRPDPIVKLRDNFGLL